MILLFNNQIHVKGDMALKKYCTFSAILRSTMDILIYLNVFQYPQKQIL